MRELVRYFLWSHCRVRMFTRAAECQLETLRVALEVGGFQSVPTPAGWKDKGDRDEPLSQEVLCRPEDLLDAFRQATEQAARIIRSKPPMPVTSNFSKKKVIVAMPKAVGERGKQSKLNAVMNRLRPAYAPLAEFTERWVTRSGRKHHVCWKANVAGLRKHLQELHQPSIGVHEGSDRPRLDGIVEDCHGTIAQAFRQSSPVLTRPLKQGLATTFSNR